MCKNIFWSAVILWIAGIFCLGQDTEGMDLYREFGSNPDLVFLKDSDIGTEIFQAMVTKNARALGGYAAVVFYAERISAKQVRQINGLKLLELATQISMSQRDAGTLTYLASIWEEPFCGAGDKVKAQGIRDYVRKLGREIQLLPEKNDLLVGEKISLQIKYADADEEVPLEELSLWARHGEISKSRDRFSYQAPAFPCEEEIKAQYLPDGHSARATIHVIEGDGGEGPQSPYKPYAPCTRMDPPIVDPSEFLLKEEQVRLRAQENMSQEIKRVLAELARYNNDFRPLETTLGRDKELVLVGVKTGNSYVCKQDPKQYLRILATLSPEDAVKTVRHNCRRNNLTFTSSMEEKFLKWIQNKPIEVEGSVRYLK